MFSDTEIKILTIDLGNQKKKIKVAFSKTLSQLRSENKWCAQHLMFVDPDDAEIEAENEQDFTVSDILNEQSMTIKMAPITKQTTALNDERFAQLQNKIEQLEEEKKKIKKEDQTEKQKSEGEGRNQKEKKADLESEIKLEEESAKLKKKKEEEEYEKSFRNPIKGSELYEKNKNNLDIYLYPRYQSKDLSDLERQNLKVIMVVGQTGSGKSTLLDAMVNYLAGVEFEDNFRYKLIDEKKIIQNKKQAESITHDVNQYYIKPKGKSRTNFPLLLVDTPGFMDTGGLNRDKQITQDIFKFFQTKIDQIHCVCLVSVSSNARLTCSQKYVFDKVLEIFGKDIEENIANLFTFCDGGQALVYQSLKNENIPLKYHYKFNNSALFSKIGDMFERMFWDMGIKSMEQFFKDVEGKFIPKSLLLTKEVLDQRKKLEHTVVNIRPRIDVGLSQLESARRELEFIEKHQAAIEGNKNFTYSYTVEKFRKVSLAPGIHTTTCINCNRTCHKNCLFSDDESKGSCCAMTNGNCTVCPKKCHWSSHSNVPHIFEYYLETEQKTSEDLKKKFVDAKSNLAKSDQILNGLSKQLLILKKEIYDDIETLSSSLNRLGEIALKPNPYSSTELMEIMIEQERQNKTPGYQERIRSLEEAKCQYEMLNKLTGKEKEKTLNDFFKCQEKTVNTLKMKEKQDNCSIF